VANGTVKWFNEQRVSGSSSRRVARTYSSTIRDPGRGLQDACRRRAVWSSTSVRGPKGLQARTSVSVTGSNQLHPAVPRGGLSIGRPLVISPRNDPPLLYDKPRSTTSRSAGISA